MYYCIIVLYWWVISYMMESGVMQSWIKSYLTNRKQNVSIKSCSSSMSIITFGVPQGLVLGPALILLHINDMHRSWNQMRFVHCADDTTVFASDSDFNTVYGTVNRELVGVDNWPKTNRLSMNVSKTTYMIIYNQKTHPTLNIELKSLRKFQQSNLLAWHLMNILFLNHVKTITAKISKSVGVMKRLHYQLHADLMVKLCYCLGYSHLTYVVLAWGRSGRTNAAC